MSARRKDVPHIDGNWTAMYVAEFPGNFRLVLSILPDESQSPVIRKCAGQYALIVQEHSDWASGTLFDKHGMRFVPFMHTEDIEAQSETALRKIMEHFDIVLFATEQDPVIEFSVWDGETQAYWPIAIWNNRFWGFPDSSKDGTPVGKMAFLRTASCVQ